MRKSHEGQRPVRWVEWLAVGLGLLLAIRTGASVLRLWKAGDRVKTAQAELELTQVENLKLKGQVAYSQSDEFVEREARDKLGLGREGEVILILPEQSESSLKSQVSNPKSEIEDIRPNWKKWWDLYLRI